MQQLVRRIWIFFFDITIATFGRGYLTVIINILMIYARIYASIGGLDSCDVYSSDPSKFYYDGDDLTHKHSHGEENP